jgi:hypothetical protein
MRRFKEMHRWLEDFALRDIFSVNKNMGKKKNSKSDSHDLLCTA